MILAVSRFRVANGMEAAVREAFINRPGFVDTASGFLGMETFTDSKDATIFYLVTRWTDGPSFHEWHRSKAHHDSHHFMPKGLKLDGTFTKVSELDRIDTALARNNFDELLFDSVPLFSRFINNSSEVHVIAAAVDGTIKIANDAVAKHSQRSAGELNGGSVWQLLTEADRETVRARVAEGTRTLDEGILLNFVDSQNAPYSLNCKLDIHPDGFVIVGEPPRKKESALQEELLELNNELATLSRENVRKKRELEEALRDLKEAQSLLVQQEKMASLGQMTAGVAHEINNPVAFVLNNHETLLRDFNDLLGVINLLGDSLDELSNATPKLYDRICDKAAEIDLEHLAETIPKKLKHNLDGLERVKRIVLDLRSFSRLDENSFKPADINEGITSTVRFLSPLIADQQVTVTTRLGKIEDLNCSPGSLNQAFSNIIANAIQASAPGTEVIISTAAEGDCCVVKVEDSGEGIAPENLSRIFDPFFTTKAVGSGTGLGLHIARQIVTAHQGRITVESTKGRGTTVCVRIPFGLESESEVIPVQVLGNEENTWSH